MTVGAASATAPVVIPFALQNWGRLVVILFGAGVATAMMAARILSAEAGIGILGVLLGVALPAVGPAGRALVGRGPVEAVLTGRGRPGGSGTE